MTTYTKSDKELLMFLLELQEHAAPIRLSIGFIKDNVVRRGIILHEAPPFVVQEVIRKGYSCGLTEEGMRVYM